MKSKLQALFFGIGILAAALLLPGTAHAFEKGEGRATEAVSGNPITFDPSLKRSFAFDNDLLVPGSRDQDYTYGLNLTFYGRGVENQWASLHKPLAWLDERLGLDHQLDNSIGSSKIEYGVFGFTPEDISVAATLPGDRPYAGLVYVSSTRERYDALSQVSWQSTLTLGVLGLSIVGDLQEQVHNITGSSQPMGWHNQISRGGEATARYSIARQSLIYQSDAGIELKTTTQASVGYISELSWSLSLRAGKIATPWISFNPELTSYGEKSNSNDVGKVSEQYFWTGLSIKGRAYNAFLQGQFRNSPVSYDSDELNHGIVEAWAGYTLALPEGYSFSYLLRGHSSELKQGSGNRNVLWGGFQITKTIG